MASYTRLAAVPMFTKIKKKYYNTVRNVKHLRQNFADYQLLEGDWLRRAGGTSTRKCFDERLPDTRNISTRLNQTHHTAHIAVTMTTADVSWLLVPALLSRTHARCFSKKAGKKTTKPFVGAIIRY